jgi:transposase
LVPSQDSSGESHHHGSITKSGNRHARRLLVEAAWHHRKSYSSSSMIMRNRWELAPVPAQVRGHQGNRRLHQRWQYFQARNKDNNIAAVAVARELAGWAWSLAIMDD